MEKAIAWAQTRGISEATLTKAGVGEGKAGFQEGVKEAVVFHYFLDGESVNYKARSIEGKSYKAKAGGQSCFYNIDSYESGPFYITEGEIDCLSLMEAGLNAVSVPFGAPGNRSDHPQETQRYKFIVDMIQSGFAPA